MNILRTIGYNGQELKFVAIIGCIRLTDRTEAPEGQEDCGPWQCDKCNAVMWSSRKKRQLLANHEHDFIKACMQCTIVIMKENGIPPSEQALIDLAKLPS